MAYCNQTDIINAGWTEKELLRLTDDESTGNINSTRVSAAITKADNLINGYCRGQHPVAWDDVDAVGSNLPPMINDISATLAGYYIWERRRKGQIDENMEGKYKRALQTLKDIASQKIFLDDADSFANTGQIISTNKTSSDKVYTSTLFNTY